MAYFDAGGKRAITVWHRRGGKDLTAMHQTCKMAHQRVAAYWHIFPTAEQGRKAIWEGFTKDGKRIMEQVFPAAIRKSPREFHPKAEMVVELRCGSIWRLLGSDKIEVVGAGPAGVVFSEYALAKPQTWDLVRPMLRENDGWMWAITTPRGKNHAHKLYEQAKSNPEWFCDHRTLFDTRAYDPERTIAEERAEGMPEELINQEYLCDWSAANVGSFYGQLLAQLEAAGRIGRPFESGTSDVLTHWDLGKTDDTAIWWWRVTEGGIDVLDHYASHGEDLEHYFDVIERRGSRYGWQYRKHWLPHDARAQRLGMKTSILEQTIARFGAAAVGIAPELDVKDGIQATRKLFKSNIRFHPRCSAVEPGGKDCDGIEALRAYHREWDADRKCFSETPVHDWSSHTSDAFRYLALSVDVLTDLLKADPPKEKKLGVSMRPDGKLDVTLDELFEERERSMEN